MKNFKPTNNLKTAAEVVLTSKAFMILVREEVTIAKQKLLNENDFLPQEELIGRCGSEPIKEIKQDFLMNEKDFTFYSDSYKAAVAKKGFTVEKPEHCPLLVAESLYRDACRELLKESKYITNIDPENIINLEKRRKMIELTLRLVVPFIDDKALIKKFNA